jgi:hypothetical protein
MRPNLLGVADNEIQKLNFLHLDGSSHEAPMRFVGAAVFFSRLVGEIRIEEDA